MNADDMKVALRRHFVRQEWDEFGEFGQLFMTEVVSPNRDRRIDVLHVNMRANRGQGIDAIEIKTSLTDFKSEIKDQNKAEAWWPYCNRFWIAVPSLDVAPPEMLPPGWGLMIPPSSERRRAMQVIVQPSERQPIVNQDLLGILMARVRNVAMETWRETVREKDAAVSNQIRDAVQAVRDQVRTDMIPNDIVRKIEQLNKLEDFLGFDLSAWDDFKSSRITPETTARVIRRLVREESEVTRDLKRAQGDARRMTGTLEDMLKNSKAVEEALAKQLKGEQ